MPENPAESWNLLRNSNGADGVLEVPSRPTGVETGFGPARFALGPAGEPRLLVPCSSGHDYRVPRTASKLDISMVQYQLNHATVPFIDMTCTDGDLDGVFAELVKEILTRLENGRTPEEATNGTIADYRDLLFLSSSAEVSKSAIVGLLGELQLLTRLAAIDREAIDSWTGPFSQRQDFRRNLAAIEVKTSTRSDATEVRIHGPEQLQEPTGGTLLLVHVKLEQSDAGFLRVKSAIDRLISLGVDQDSILTGLTQLSCTDPADPSWNRFAFELQGISAYRVLEGFPRIVPGSFADACLPAGASKLEYSVDLTHAENFRLDSSELDACLQEFMA